MLFVVIVLERTRGDVSNDADVRQVRHRDGRYAPLMRLLLVGSLGAALVAMACASSTPSTVPCVWNGKDIGSGADPASTGSFPKDGDPCAQDELKPGQVCRAGPCPGQCARTCRCKSGMWSCGLECRDIFEPVRCGTAPVCDDYCTALDAAVAG